MSSNKILDLKDDILALEERKAKLRVEEEALVRSIAEKSESLSDIRTRIIATGQDYDTIAKEHTAELLDYEKRSRELQDAIISDQNRLKGILDQIAVLQPAIEALEAKKTLLEGSVSELDKEIESKTTELNTLKADFDSLAEEKRQTITDLEAKIKELKKEADSIKTDSDERLANVENAERLIGIKKSDIEILEKRFREKYPDEPIIL